MYNPFQPIPADAPNAQEELRRRQEINNMVDWMNKLAALNPNNRTLQNYLLNQYMSLIMPQPINPEEEYKKSVQDLDIAMSLIDYGDDKLSKIGQVMLLQNPIIRQYMANIPGNKPNEQSQTQPATTHLPLGYSEDNVNLRDGNALLNPAGVIANDDSQYREAIGDAWHQLTAESGIKNKLMGLGRLGEYLAPVNLGPGIISEIIH